MTNDCGTKNERRMAISNKRCIYAPLQQETPTTAAVAVAIDLGEERERAVKVMFRRSSTRYELGPLHRGSKVKFVEKRKFKKLIRQT